MSKNTEKKPRLRFPEFTDDWMQLKVDDIANRFDNLRIPVTSSKRIPGKIPYYGANGIQDYVEGFTHNGEYILVAEDGANDLKNYPVHYVNGKIWVNNHAHVLQAKEGYSTKFLKFLFQRKNISSFLVGGGRAKLNADVMMKLYLSLPSTLEEQERIASLFFKIENFITINQFNLEILKNIKKGFLQKLFPKEGETNPVLRFPGFNDSWKQSKAKELCSIGTGKSNTQDQIENGKYPFYIRSDVPVRSNKFLFDCEAVITIGDGNIGRVFHYVNGKFDLHQRCYKMTDFRNILGKYFYYFFSTKFYKRAMSMSAKATVDSVRMEMISDMDIKYPANINEQKKISAFFSDIDRLLDLNQKSLEILQNIKKGLLQQMFV